MKLGSSLLLVLVIIAWQGTGFAQKPTHVPGEILVSFHAGANPESVLRRLESQTPLSGWVLDKKVSGLLNVWSFSNPENIFEVQALNWFRRQPEVQMAQFNHELSLREQAVQAPQQIHLGPSLWPNDPFVDQQWQYKNTITPGADLSAAEAWGISTGGVTPAGDSIVLAVIDGGIDQNHADWADNLWRNRLEIPNDNIDNDGNGFVDDYRGWNFYDNNDDIGGATSIHGTPVGGIVAAKGNNALGIAGTNWNAKLMFIAGKGLESVILQSYDYVYAARKRYNDTHGAKGAFVVAVNCSWGVNYGQPSDAPLWCAALDSLGTVGILTVGATANIPVDVDVAGDLPTTCPSDYLISVTSVTKTDAKASNAAWGAQAIDLGAPGQDIYTLVSGNKYAFQSGTSFAAPHVSGALGLLYAAPCPNLVALAKTEPASAALWAKTILLNSAVPIPALKDITHTGSRLNLFYLLQQYESQCAPCPAPFSLQATDITGASARLTWSEISAFQNIELRWRKAGNPDWKSVPGVGKSHDLDGLLPCTNYEFALRADCSDSLQSDWSAAFAFKTDGCCLPPDSLKIDWVTMAKAQLSWKKVTAAKGFRLRLRQNNGPWKLLDVDDNSVVMESLLPCLDYEVQVQTLCDTGYTVFSPGYFFKTMGCGACTDATYCSASASQATEEWIEGVQIGSWSHYSGGQTGYQNFTDISGTYLKINSFEPQSITLTPGYSGQSYKEYFRVFIDYNTDGDFDEPDEVAFDAGWASNSPISGQLNVPAFSGAGFTRMRIAMKYTGASSSPPGFCEHFDFGQVEDYCVFLSPGNVSAGFDNGEKSRLKIYPQPTPGWVTIQLPPEAPYDATLIRLLDATGRLLYNENASRDRGQLATLNLSLYPSGFYIVQVICGAQTWEELLIRQ